MRKRLGCWKENQTPRKSCASTGVENRQAHALVARPAPWFQQEIASFPHNIQTVPSWVTQQPRRDCPSAGGKAIQQLLKRLATLRGRVELQVYKEVGFQCTVFTQLCALQGRRHARTHATFSPRVTQEFFEVTSCSPCTLEKPISLLKLGMAAGTDGSFLPLFTHCSCCTGVVSTQMLIVCCADTLAHPEVIFQVLSNVTTPDWFCKYKRLPE